MRSNYEDQLARLAFGELSETEAAQLESCAMSDPGLQKTLREYKSLREGLRALTDVPDHQLSNERLRDAILGNGLSPKKVRNSDWSWLWMSAMAASLAVGLMVGLHRNRTDAPQLIGLNDSTLRSPGTSLSTNLFSEVGKSSEAQITARLGNPKKKPQASVTVIAFNKATQVRHLHRHIQSNELSDHTLEALFTSQVAPAGDKQTAPPAHPTLAAATNAAPALKPVDDTPSPAVVEIEPDKDQNTGAQRATELGAPNNVIVGG